MLNEKKIKLMTKIAIYEKNEKEDLTIASKSFKVDYVTLNMLYTVIAVTIGFVLLIVLYILGNLEALLVNASVTEIAGMIADTASYYVTCVVIFLFVSGFYYARRYDKAFEKVKRNYSDIKSLLKMIEK